MFLLAGSKAEAGVFCDRAVEPIVKQGRTSGAQRGGGMFWLTEQVAYLPTCPLQ